MAITLEQYKKLRDGGLAPEQIAQQEQGKTGLSGFARGVAKGELSTIQGLSKLGAGVATKFNLPGQLTQFLTKGKRKAPVAQPIFKPEFEQKLTPETRAESLGKGFEQIAEFLVPSSKLAKLEKGLPLTKRAIAEAGTFGAITAAQTGELGDEAKTAAIIGGLFPVAGATLKALKPKGGIRAAVGEKIQQTVIRPTSRDFKDGFKLSNVNKFKLGGELQQTALKTQSAINARLDKMRNLEGASTGIVDIKKILEKTLLEFTSNGVRFKQFGSIGATERAVKDLVKEVSAVSPKQTPISIVEATLMKRGAGTKSSWAFGQPDRDAKALDKVYTAFYLNLKKDIVNAAGKEGKEIDRLGKEISELIPISNAVVRRLPVAQRNNVISLTDSIGLFAAIFHPGALALIGANTLSKSGKFGAFLVKSAEKTKIGASVEKARGAIGERFLGGSFKKAVPKTTTK